MTRKPKPKSKRKPGGQKGNKNALRHGFYSKMFTEEERQRLDAQKKIIDSEIAINRVAISRIWEQIDFKPKMRLDNNGSEYRDSHYLSQVALVGNISSHIAGFIRTDFLTTGKETETRTTILLALEQLREELEMNL